MYVPLSHPPGECDFGQEKAVIGGVDHLADQIPDIAQAAVGSGLKFNIRIELGGDPAPAPVVVDKINALLSDVSDDLKLA